MGTTITKDVLTGKDARRFVSAVNVKYGKDDYRDVIFDDNNIDNFLLITKKIGSVILIDDVKVVTDDLIESMISD